MSGRPQRARANVSYAESDASDEEELKFQSTKPRSTRERTARVSYR